MDSLMVIKTHKINHGVDKDVLMWVSQQPNFLGFEITDTSVKATFDHDVIQESNFKRDLSRMISLDGENLNKYDDDLYTKGNPPGVNFYAVKPSDQTNIGTAYADTIGTGLAVLANTTYEFEFNIIADADAATTGVDVACNGPASPISINYIQSYWTTATALSFRPATAYNNNTASTGSAGAIRAIYRVFGILRNGPNAGTLIATIKRENVGSANVGTMYGLL
jgi:hypothetical protein